MNYAKKFDLSTLISGQKYSTDNASTLSVVNFEVKKLEKKKIYDYIITLQPTSPLRNHNHIDYNKFN